MEVRTEEASAMLGAVGGAGLVLRTELEPTGFFKNGFGEGGKKETRKN